MTKWGECNYQDKHGIQSHLLLCRPYRTSRDVNNLCKITPCLINFSSTELAYMDVFVCPDKGVSQAQPVQGALFVCLDASRARPARCIKQLRTRPPRNTPPPRFSRARLDSASRAPFWPLAGWRSPSRARCRIFPSPPRR